VACAENEPAAILRSEVRIKTVTLAIVAAVAADQPRPVQARDQIDNLLLGLRSEIASTHIMLHGAAQHRDCVVCHQFAKLPLDPKWVNPKVSPVPGCARRRPWISRHTALVAISVILKPRQPVTITVIRQMQIGKLLRLLSCVNENREPVAVHQLAVISRD
jgi:hypothetical protein